MSETLDALFDFMMDHPAGTTVVSSVIGSLLGVLLAFKVLIPLIVQM